MSLRFSTIIILTFICSITGYLCVSCSKSGVNSSTLNSDEPDEAFLEIKQNAMGNVFPSGEKLVMRLYKSGRFEYDSDPKGNTRTDPQGKVLFERKWGRINVDDVNRLMNLAEQSDFQNAKDFYPTIHLHTDDKWTTIVTYTNQGKTKKIVADDFWDVGSHAEDKSKYPSALIELLYKQRSLKAKAVNEL